MLSMASMNFKPNRRVDACHLKYKNPPFPSKFLLK